MDEQTTQGLKRRQSELAQSDKRNSEEFRHITALLQMKLAESDETSSGVRVVNRPDPKWHLVANEV